MQTAISYPTSDFPQKYNLAQNFMLEHYNQILMHQLLYYFFENTT